VINAAGAVANVANIIAGANTPWYLLDTRRPLKPLIFQDRRAANFVALQDDKDQNVFLRNEYLYGVDMRCNVGFGFWQMAVRSSAALDAAGFAAADLMLSSFTKDYGQPLGVAPNLLVCGPSNKAAAKAVIEAQFIAGGGSNINYKSVDLLVVPWLP
jgi:phage major head subunit gpT-like protein